MSRAVTLLLTSFFIDYSLSTLIVDPNPYQYEVRPLIPDNRFVSYPNANPLMYQMTPEFEVPEIPEQRNVRQLQPFPPKVPTDTSLITKGLSTEINEIMDSLNKLTENRMTENRMVEHQDSRAAERADDFGLYRRSDGYPASPPSYGPWSPTYGSPSYGPPQKHEPLPKLSLLKPDLLLKPVAVKAADKISGLIELVLALLTGSAPNDLQLKGFKDIVIYGIVKPLLTAKGGLKSLISKLSIPVISLLLINLEVLITIWWLWEEDCPAPAHHRPVYGYPSKPAYHVPSNPPSYAYNGNNYNPYR